MKWVARVWRYGTPDFEIFVDSEEEAHRRLDEFFLNESHYNIDDCSTEIEEVEDV